MTDGAQLSAEAEELKAAIDLVLNSPSRKKLVIAGPGTGKTSLFKQMLERANGGSDRRIVLTFINNLKDDLEDELAGLAEVFTLHSFCFGLLHRNAALRASLSRNFRCYPGLASLIAQDWEFIEKSGAPKFVGEMRTLAKDNHTPFYLARGDYYNAVDFDDTIYRVYEGLSSGRAAPEIYDLVLIDEYQDFNTLEAGFIDILGKSNSIVIAGDDDQALYSQLRDASWNHIRLLSTAGEYEVFKLPFCMRCPKVVVDSISDILTRSRQLHKLVGRIEKPYKHFAPVKGADSAKYPRIVHVETSVQRQDANYMGRYISQAIAEIPLDEIEAATRGSYPAALVIVAKPYRDQIISHLKGEGYVVDIGRESVGKPDRQVGLSILKEDRDSNLGWRIILGIDTPPFLAHAIFETADRAKLLADVLPSEYRKFVLAEVDAHEPTQEIAEGDEESPAVTDLPSVRVTSFEGAKGLSAQHVFIAGLHDGELPHDPAAIKDIEICKFVVGLTRTRKKCTLIRTRNFAGNWKPPSTFISWIDDARLHFIKVDAEYWKKQFKSRRDE